MINRLPFEPLERVLTNYFNGLPVHVSGCGCNRGNFRQGGFCWTLKEAGEAIGFSGKTLTDWRNDGVPARKADAIAVRLARMPWEIWPEWSEWADSQEETRKSRAITAAKARAKAALQLVS